MHGREETRSLRWLTLQSSYSMPLSLAPQALPSARQIGGAHTALLSWGRGVTSTRTRNRNYLIRKHIRSRYHYITLDLHAQPKQINLSEREVKDLLWTAKMTTKLAQATLLLHLCVALEGVVLEPRNGEDSRTTFTSEMFNNFLFWHATVSYYSHVCENSRLNYSTAKRLYQTAWSTWSLL